MRADVSSGRSERTSFTPEAGYGGFGHCQFKRDAGVDLLGGAFRTRVVSYSESFPLDGALTVGFGTQIGDGPDLFFLPVGISPVIAGATWRLMLDHRFGPVNQVIAWFAGREVELLWTVDPLLVWPAIMLAEVWQWTPFMFLLLLAALASVDREQLEAAELDGASWWMTFRSVVLPAIMPVVVIALLIRGLDLIRIFDIVWTMTRGGPGTMTESISIYAYQMAFREFDISYSAAIAVLIIALLTAMVVTVLSRVEISR